MQVNRMITFSVMWPVWSVQSFQQGKKSGHLKDILGLFQYVLGSLLIINVDLFGFPLFVFQWWMFILNVASISNNEFSVCSVMMLIWLKDRWVRPFTVLSCYSSDFSETQSWTHGSSLCWSLSHMVIFQMPNCKNWWLISCCAPDWFVLSSTQVKLSNRYVLYP